MDSWENITDQVLEAKGRTQYSITDDSDLDYAAKYAISEASRWDNAISVLQQANKQYFDCQICVMTVLSAELYLKATLMLNGINVTKDRDCMQHNLRKLFEKLEESDQLYIKEQMEPCDTETILLISECIVLRDFDQKLDFISNDFINLRYHYEKFLNGEPILTLQKFTLDFRDCVRDISNRKSKERGF